MSHAKIAVYYPEADVSSEWLRSAALFWEKIETIVPPNYDHTAKESPFVKSFRDEKVIRDMVVRRFSPEVKAASELVIDVLESPVKIHFEVDPELVAERSYTRIYDEKTSWLLQQRLEQRLGVSSYEGQVRMPPLLADYHMAALATNLASRRGFAPVSPTDYSNKIATAVAAASGRIPRWTPDGQAHLFEFVVESFRVADDVSAEEILDFRRSHREALGRFRTAIAKLAPPAQTPDALAAVEHARVIFEDQYLPSVTELREQVEGSRIRTFVAETLSWRTLAGAAGLAALGAPFVPAIVGAGGIALMVGAVRHTLERQRLGRDGVSYALAVEAALGPERGR